MDDLKILIPLALAYLALVLIFPVKRGRQPALPWVLSVLAQTATVYFFSHISAEAMILLPELLEKVRPDLYLSESDCIIGAALVAVLANILFILLVNCLFLGNEKHRVNQQEKMIRSSMSAEQAEEDAKAEKLQKDIAAAAIRINSGGDDKKNRNRK